MNYEGTVLRLEGLLDARREQQHLYTVRNALDRLIEAQVDRVKVNVMTYCFEAFDYFNGKEAS
jgi:hypothetical protein